VVSGQPIRGFHALFQLEQQSWGASQRQGTLEVETKLLRRSQTYLRHAIIGYDPSWALCVQRRAKPELLTLMIADLCPFKPKTLKPA
jgi:hypothetical protein